jgi:Putative transposase
MRRFLQHGLPCGFHKIRYFGLWHLAQRHNAARARQMLQLQASPKPKFDSALRNIILHQCVAGAQLGLCTTPSRRRRRLNDQRATGIGAESQMFGGKATPTARKAFPATLVTGVRKLKCLPSCSTSISYLSHRFGHAIRNASGITVSNFRMSAMS